MITIVKYSSNYKNEWNSLVFSSNNGHFMHSREYMEYHSNRFEDFSFLFFEKGAPIALIAANKDGETLYSHQGLSFGGLIIKNKISTPKVLEIFSLLVSECKNLGFKKIVYKRIPDIFYENFSQDDLYALFRNNFTLTKRDLNSVVCLAESYKLSKGRKWAINKAKKNNIEIVESNNFSEYWMVLTETLSKHNAKPTHTLDEIIKLSGLFKRNIKLFCALKDNDILAGTLVFDNRHLVHTQYMASTCIGRDIGALDFLNYELMTNFFSHKKYFNFGISTELNGTYLNEGLLSQKNGFGARSTVYESYEVRL